MTDSSATGGARVPGKAAGLSRLQAAGIRVPAWRLIDSAALAPLIPAELAALAPPRALAADDIERLARWRHAIEHAPLPGAAADALARATAELPAGPLMVRSASALEDRPHDSAAGLFESRGPVPGSLDELGAAARAVAGSLATPAVWAHLAARRLRFGDVRMAIVVQSFVAGTRATGYTRAPDGAAAPAPDAPSAAEAAGPGDAALLELADERWARVDRSSGAVVASAGDGPWQALAELGVSCERALGGAPVDFEAVVASAAANAEGPALWAVQARPIVPGAAPRPTPTVEALAFSRSTPGVEWKWDVEHNPEPLSPAQAGLVEHVDAGRLAPFLLRVVDGYLYWAPRHPVATAPLGGALYVYETAAVPRVAEAVAGADADPSLTAALAAYSDIYDVWANKLAPAVAESRRELPNWLADAAPDLDGTALVAELVSGPSDARAETLAARVAAGSLGRSELVARVGAMAAAWDVRCPTLAEQTGALERLIAGANMPSAERAARARRTLRDAVPAWRHSELDELMARAQQAADVAELDDRLFAQAQWLVRRSLLRLATRCALDADDAFFLPLADLLAADRRGSIDRRRADDQIERARHRLARQRELAMPLAIRDGAGRSPLPGPSSRRWRGRGCGGQTAGPAARVQATGAPVAAGAIAVCAAITPGMLALVRDAGAFVCERGGLLDHGAAMARSLGVPIVVGCADVTRHVRDGAPLWVDGDAGLVCAL